MWAAVIVCLLLSGIIFYALAKFHYKIESDSLISDETTSYTHQLSALEFNKMNIHAKYTRMKNQHQKRIEKDQPVGLYIFGNLINSMLYTFSMMLMVSIPKLPIGWSIRVLTGWYWLYCLLVVVAYRASMTAILANPAPR